MVSIAKIILEVKLWHQTAEPQFWISERTYLKRLAVYLETNLPTSPHASLYCQTPPTVRSYQRLISHSEGRASDPKFVPEAHVYQIFDRNCPNPRPTRDCLRSADTFRPDAHDRYMSLGEIPHIHSLAQSPTPKHCC